MSITLTHYLVLASILFVIGLIGVIRRKNLLLLFFSTEILLNAVNIAFTAISKYYHDLTGQMFSFFVIAVAASEVAVGLGLLVLWYKRNSTIDLESLQEMKG